MPRPNRRALIARLARARDEALPPEILPAGAASDDPDPEPPRAVRRATPSPSRAWPSPPRRVAVITPRWIAAAIGRPDRAAVRAVEDAIRRGACDVTDPESVVAYIVRARGRARPGQSRKAQRRAAAAKADAAALRRQAEAERGERLAARARRMLATAPPSPAQRAGTLPRGWADAAF